MRSSIAVLALTGLLCFAGEKKVKLEKLPLAVQQAVKEQTKTAALVGITQETEDGKTTYEVETKVDGHTRDVNLDANGAVVLVEEETPIEKIPAPARAGIEKKASGGKIAKVETITKGSTVTYEALITGKGKKFEYVVTPDGSPTK
jgi:hypothetical protein